MTSEQDNRVLSRRGARPVREEEMYWVNGATDCTFTENCCLVPYATTPHQTDYKVEID